MLRDLVVNQGVKCAICTPILDAQNQVVGFFVVQDRKDSTPFTPADVDFLMALSPIASIALENAQAYQKISEAEQAVQGSFGQLRALAARLQTIREEERTDMARELHDELGQALTALKMDTASLINRLPPRSKLLRERAQAMSEQIDATIKTVRRMSSQLRPGMLDDLGLGPSIEWYAQEFQTRTGIVVETEVMAEELDLDHTRATALYRIFQETLTNVARHSKATTVKAKLEIEDSDIRLEIADNGQGFDPVQVRGKRSLGLLGMRERAEMAQGSLEIEGAPGKGTKVIVKVPLGQQASQG
jgi:signal transduction histidine kinase